MGFATDIIRTQYACIACRLGARSPKLERHIPVCPQCQQSMAQWPWKGSFPKKTSKLWKRLSIYDGPGLIQAFPLILYDGEFVKTGPQGWDCHGDTRLKRSKTRSQGRK